MQSSPDVPAQVESLDVIKAYIEDKDLRLVVDEIVLNMVMTFCINSRYYHFL